MVTKHLARISIAALSTPALGLASYGVANAVSSSPGPQVVIPASFHSSNVGADDPANHEANEVPGADDPANHDANEVPGTDDPANHDANNTSRRASVTSASTRPSVAPVTASINVSQSDDGPGHDLFDDHGDRATTGSTSVTGATSGRDDSGSSRSGSSRSGSSGRGSGGSDDGPGHN